MKTISIIKRIIKMSRQNTNIDKNFDFDALIKELKLSLNNYEELIIKLEKNNDCKYYLKTISKSSNSLNFIFEFNWIKLATLKKSPLGTKTSMSFDQNGKKFELTNKGVE